MSKKNQTCPKCHLRKRMTSHHVFPRRHFGNNRTQRRLRLRICRSCHDDLERLIPFERMPATFYVQVVVDFLGEEHVPPHVLPDTTKFCRP